MAEAEKLLKEILKSTISTEIQEDLVSRQSQAKEQSPATSPEFSELKKKEIEVSMLNNLQKLAKIEQELNSIIPSELLHKKQALINLFKDAVKLYSTESEKSTADDQKSLTPKRMAEIESEFRTLFGSAELDEFKKLNLTSKPVLDALVILQQQLTGDALAQHAQRVKQRSEIDRELVKLGQTNKNFELMKFEDDFPDLKFFNFKDQNVVLSVEAIVRSCFANPRRTKQSCVRYASTILFSGAEEYSSAEKVLDIIKKSVPLCFEEFNSKKIRLLSEEGIKPGNDIKKWKEGLQNSRWYGPFVWRDEKGVSGNKKAQIVLIFHSVTHDGFFDGIAIGCETENKRLYCLRFKDSGIEIAKGLYFSESKLSKFCMANFIKKNWNRKFAAVNQTQKCALCLALAKGPLTSPTPR